MKHSLTVGHAAGTASTHIVSKTWRVWRWLALVHSVVQKHHLHLRRASNIFIHGWRKRNHGVRRWWVKCTNKVKVWNNRTRCGTNVVWTSSTAGICNCDVPSWCYVLKRWGCWAVVRKSIWILWTSCTHLGNSGAQFNLGCLYYNGQGVERRELKIAKQWFEKTAA